MERVKLIKDKQIKELIYINLDALFQRWKEIDEKEKELESEGNEKEE